MVRFIIKLKLQKFETLFPDRQMTHIENIKCKKAINAMKMQNYQASLTGEKREIFFKEMGKKTAMSTEVSFVEKYPKFSIKVQKCVQIIVYTCNLIPTETANY